MGDKGRSRNRGGQFRRQQQTNGNHTLPIVDSQGSQQVITADMIDNQSPYSGWKMYQKQETEQRKRRSPNWGEAETQLLLRLWAERFTEMKTIKRNGFVLEEIAQTLQAHGFTRSSAEVKTRIANLSQEYRMETRKRSLGFPHGNFKLWDAVHAILGNEDNGNSFQPSEHSIFMSDQLQNTPEDNSGGEEGAENLCCAIDPVMYMGHQGNGNDEGEIEEGTPGEEEEEEYDEDDDNLVIDMKQESSPQRQTPPSLQAPVIPILPNIPPSLTISLTSAPTNGTPKMPALIRVNSKRNSMDNIPKHIEKKPRLSVDSAAVTHINVEDLLKHKNDIKRVVENSKRVSSPSSPSLPPWQIIIDLIKQESKNAEIRNYQLAQAIDQNMKLQRQNILLQKQILSLIENQQELNQQLYGQNGPVYEQENNEEDDIEEVEESDNIEVKMEDTS